MISKDEIVMSYWAIGPTYRTALRKNLEENVFNKEFFKMIILTDYPSDFEDYRTIPNVLDILDLKEQRIKFDWSYEIEPVPTAKTVDEYGIQFKDMLRMNKKFSYSLHRFSIPWLINNGYHKFIIMDGDVHLNMKNLDLQTWTNVFLDVDAKVIAYGDEVKSGSEYDEFYTYLTSYLKQDTLFSSILQFPPCPDKHLHHDGPFRFYNFDNIKEAMIFFSVWNSSVEYMLKYGIDLMYKCSMIGGVMYNDELILGTTNYITNCLHVPINGNAVNVHHNPKVDRRFLS